MAAVADAHVDAAMADMKFPRRSLSPTLRYYCLHDFRLDA